MFTCNRKKPLVIYLVQPKTPTVLHALSFSVLQSCALIFSANFQCIFTFKWCTTQISH